MTAIVLKNFKGIAPYFNPKFLPPGYGQDAQNCEVGGGRLRPYKGLSTEDTWAQGTYGPLRTIYRYGSNFLFWTDEGVSVVEGEVPSGDNRLFYTGNGYPKQTDTNLMTATGYPSSTSQYRRLGVTPPAAALTIHGPTGTGDGTVQKTVSYYYTYVCKWSDGTEEESKPSPPTANVDIEGGEYLSLSNFVVPSLATSGNNVTHLRLYRLEVGNVGAAYTLLEARPGSATATGVWDIPVASITDTSTQVYDTDGVPSGLNDEVDEPCPTEDWSPPDNAMTMIGQFANGMLGGFVSNTFRVSEPYYWYAWNPLRKVTLNSTPVAWGSYRGMAIVATTAYPYVITGSDPESLVGEPLLYQQSCVSARAFVTTPYGCIYPSPDGIVLINENGLTMLTEKIMTKRQWEDYAPTGFTHASLVGFYHDGLYFGFWSGTPYGFVFNFRDEPYIIDLDIAVTVYHGCVDPEDDTLYLLTKNDTNYLASGWAKNESVSLTTTFKSRKIQTGPTSFGYGIIIGDQDDDQPITLTIYGDGEELTGISTLLIVRTADGNPVVTNDGNYVTLLSGSIIEENLFSLPKNDECSVHEVQIYTQAEIDAVIIATSPEEVMEQVEALLNG